MIIDDKTYLKVKYLQSDNGGEYVDDDFKKYCADNAILCRNGIKMKKTILVAPQQNGVAEMNRILNDQPKNMRLYAGLPKMFWAKAISNATFVINGGPSTLLNCRIPKKV